MRLPTAIALSVLPLALLAAAPGVAQEAAREVVIAQENVRFDYAQVLDVQPVYQVLRTTRMERKCEEPPAEDGRLARMVGAVKEAMGARAEAPAEDPCKIVPVTRDYRRPIAYDVDYVYKGAKYRTRMAQDPGNRLRLRVSITPQPVP